MSEDLTKKLPKGDSEKIALILTTVQNLDSQFGGVIGNLITRIEKLEKTVEERLYDTRPIWQTVVADVDLLKKGQTRLEEGQTRLEEGQTRLEEGQTRLEEGQTRLEGDVREISFKLDVLNGTMLNVQAKHKDVDHRVRELEAHQKPTNSQT